jgi:hypothetical protein
VSIGCVGRDQPNLPRLQAGVCSERFPDLRFVRSALGFLEGDLSAGEKLTDLTNLMVGLAAILMGVVACVLSVFGRKSGSGCEVELVFASAGLALVDVLYFYVSRLKDTIRDLLNSLRRYIEKQNKKAVIYTYSQEQ